MFAVHRKNLIANFIFASLLGTLGAAHAVVVAPGDTVSLPGTTLAAQPFLQGHVLEDELIPFSLAVSQTSSDLITGTVQQRVVREDVSGTLDFYWRITQLSTGSLGYFRVGKFVTNTFDADYRIDGMGDVGPASLTHFTNGLGGATDNFGANFNFVSGTADTLSAGQSSKFMLLHTDATNYAKTAFFDIASTGTYTASTQFAAFAPAPVPELQTYALMLAGLGAVGMVVRRRKQG